MGPCRLGAVTSCPVGHLPADAALAGRLTAEGLRLARSTTISPKAVEVIRRRYRQEALLQRFRTQEQIDGSWTV
jgi:hypothetical protein